MVFQTSTIAMASIVIAKQEFTILNRLGAGGFSRVYEVCFVNNGKGKIIDYSVHSARKR